MAEDAAQNVTPAADGYYGDDDMNNEEIDLSFLDDDESESSPKDASGNKK